MIDAQIKIKHDGENYDITITALPRKIGRPPLLNILLFILTFLAVLIMATYRQVGAQLLDDPFLLVKGLPFTITLMTILLLHEMGHFWAGNRRGVRMSYPFFIPAPTFIGTFGAIPPAPAFCDRVQFLQPRDSTGAAA